jgi:hypothetical protein
MDYDNPWVYKNKIFTSDDIDEYVSFVYIITNLKNHKKYIGKKTFVNTTRVAKKNTKRRKIVRKESDWKKYYGSSKSLLSDIEIYGKEHFRRTILHLCKNKSQATYYEAKEQFKRGCLESDKWYNEWIYCKIQKSNIILRE